MSALGSADAVRRMMNACEKPEDIACRKLTKRIDRLITSQGEKGESTVQFQIPVFVWAVPAYDAEKVAESVANAYADKGFVVRITNALEFEISWVLEDPEVSESEETSETRGDEESEHEQDECEDGEEDEEDEEDDEPPKNIVFGSRASKSFSKSPRYG